MHIIICLIFGIIGRNIGSKICDKLFESKEIEE